MGRGLNTVRATGCTVVTRAKGHVLYVTRKQKIKYLTQLLILIDSGYYLLNAFT